MRHELRCLWQQRTRGASVFAATCNRICPRSCNTKDHIMATQDDFNDNLDTPTEKDLDDCYGSKYLGAVDLGDRKVRSRIGKIRKETMPQRDGKPSRPKIVIYFTTLDKPLVLNATNKDTLEKALGRNPASWIGAEIGIFAADTQLAASRPRVFV